MKGIERGGGCEKRPTIRLFICRPLSRGACTKPCKHYCRSAALLSSALTTKTCLPNNLQPAMMTKDSNTPRTNCSYFFPVLRCCCCCFPNSSCQGDASQHCPVPSAVFACGTLLGTRRSSTVPQLCLSWSRSLLLLPQTEPTPHALAREMFSSSRPDEERSWRRKATT